MKGYRGPPVIVDLSTFDALRWMVDDEHWVGEVALVYLLEKTIFEERRQV